MRKLRDNGLSLVMMGLFVLFLAGQSISGWFHHNEEQREHQQQELTWSQYVASGPFLESVFENWESEFLQMGAFIFFSAFLVQRGSSQSKKPEDLKKKEDPQKEMTPDSPWPVHRGGWVLKLYNHSLTLAMLGLFLFSFAMHAVTGAKDYNEEATAHGQPTLTVLSFLKSSQFWFQSFQNWQSEFLSIAALIILSIFLRQKESPESKPVHAPNKSTEP
jgi:hypothetical protein